MESDDESEKVLNKLDEFHKHQKELAWQRKKKRNTEVDQLISQLADPKVAEKLRIYRLVEDQFDFIESEVEKEVKAELEAKKRALKKVPDAQSKRLAEAKNSSPTKLLQKARQLRMELAKEIESNEPPEPIRNNLKLIEEERKLKAKEKLFSRSGPRGYVARGPVEKVIYQPRRIDNIPSKPAIQVKKNKPTVHPRIKDDSKITMLSKPIVRDLTEQERRDLKPRSNVGYVAYEHNEEDEFNKTPQNVLSAHKLGGINISPWAPCLVMQPNSKSNVKIVHEIYVEDPKKTMIKVESPVHQDEIDHSEEQTNTQVTVEPKVKHNDDLIKTLVQEEIPDIEDKNDVPEKPDEESKDSQKEAVETAAADYSDEFEEDFEDGDTTEDLLKEFIPKVMAMKDFTENDDSTTGRLSTIMEVTSQATDSIENSNKEKPLIAEEGPLSSSSQSSSIITSPIQKQPTAATKVEKVSEDVVSQHQDSFDKLSLSEGPVVPSEDTSIQSFANDQDQLPQPFSRVVQGNVATTIPDLDLTASEHNSLAKNTNSSTSSSSAAMASSTSSISLQMSTFSKTESEFSEGQVLVLRNLVSEGEINLEQTVGTGTLIQDDPKRMIFSSTNSDLSLKDSLEEGEI